MPTVGAEVEVGSGVGITVGTNDGLFPIADPLQANAKQTKTNDFIAWSDSIFSNQVWKDF